MINQNSMSTYKLYLPDLPSKNFLSLSLLFQFILFCVFWISLSFSLLSFSLFVLFPRHVPNDSTLPPVPPCLSSPSPFLPHHPSSPSIGARLNKRGWASSVGFLFNSCSISFLCFMCTCELFNPSFDLVFHVIMQVPIQTEMQTCYSLIDSLKRDLSCVSSKVELSSAYFHSSTSVQNHFS